MWQKKKKKKCLCNLVLLIIYGEFIIIGQVIQYSNTIIIVSVSLIVQQTDLTQTIIFQAITVLEAAQVVNTVINVHIPITTT